MNKEIIELDQDPLGIEGDVVKEYDNGKVQVWVKPLEHGAKAIALLNRSTTLRSIIFNLSDLGISGRWRVRDLWERNKDKGHIADRFKVQVPSHGTAVLKISPEATQ